MRNSSDSIQKHRRSIDRLDEQLLRLLHRRLKTAIKIGELKCRQRLAVRDPAREARILSRSRTLWCRMGKSPIPLPLLEQWVRLTLRMGRESQQSLQKISRKNPRSSS